VDWQLQEPCALETDRAGLRLVVQNVLDNAVSHSRAGGHIRIESTMCDGQVELLVRNSAESMSAQDAARVFDRFWRGDQSRRATGQHCGLGLSLCQALTELLGGSIRAECPAAEDFAVTIRLSIQERNP
jgi:signal transduction histidine kinase